jgi:hypothetical protein
VAGSTNLKNFSGNWFGTISPVVTTANSTEPGYAAQIPVIFGGTATAPGGQPDIAGPASDNFDISPLLNSGTDTSAGYGFQGDFSSITATTQLAQSGTAGRIDEAISALTNNGTLFLQAGAYVEPVTVTTAGKAVNLKIGTAATAAAVTIVGNVTLDADDSLYLEAGPTSDLLTVTGAATLGGSMVVLDELDTLPLATSFVLLQRGVGIDSFGNVAAGDPLLLNGDAASAHYDLGTGNDFGIVTVTNPTISNAAGAFNYSEQQGPKVIIPSATLQDMNTLVLNGGSLQVIISQNAEAADTLSITNAGQITVAGNVVSYAGDAIATVSGGANGSPLMINFNSDGFATILAVRGLLRSIAYENGSELPAAGKKILFVLDDGAGGATALTKSVVIVPVNDAPVLNTANSPQLVGIKEDATNLPGRAISFWVNNAQSDVDGAAALKGIAIVGADNTNGHWEYQMTAGVWLAMGTLSETSALLLANTPTTLVRFVPNANYNGSATITFRAWDQTEGTAGDANFDLTGKLGGSHAFSVDSDTALQVVQPANDAPVMVPHAPHLPNISEDVTNPAGTLVSTLLGSSVTDIDAGAVQGIAVTRVTLGGQWQYKLSSALNWVTIQNAPDADNVNQLATLIPADALVRFLPNANFSGAAKIFFRAWDQTEGIAGAMVSIKGKIGGVHATSEAFDNASLTVVAKNDDPVLSVSGSTGYRRNMAPVLLTPFASVSDADGGNFAGGQLKLHFTGAADASNQLGIAGAFIVDGTDVELGGIVIGTLSSNGQNGSDLTIDLQANVTVSTDAAADSVMRQLVRSITFKTTGASAAGTRTIEYTLTDGDGGTAALQTKTVNVVN